MKRSFKYILFSGLIAGLSLSSCSKDFLDLPPATSVDADEAILTDNDMLSALTGSYAGMRVFDLYGRTLPLVGDLQADNVIISSRNAGRYTEFYQNTYLVNNQWVTGFWSNAYRVILRVNNIINATPTVTNQANVDQYLGEAYAIRALMYFELVRSFAKPYTDDPQSLGVPIVLDFDIDNKPARATVAEVYEQINADLDHAYTLMSQSPQARFSKYAARGLAAKVQLTMGTTASYQKAFDYAKDVIDNSGVELLGYDNYTAFWANSSPQVGTEVLFEIISDQIDNAGFDELPYFFHQQGYGDGLTSEEVYDLYSDDDIRKSVIVVGARTRAENPAYIISKYPDLVNYGTKKVLRLSDVYLIASEAAYEIGDIANAQSYLEDLLAERDPDNADVTETGNELFDRIILERRKELAFEGDRIHTLNRLQRDVVNRGGSTSAKEIPYNDFRRIFPIPQGETDRNENIVQNDGWIN